MLKHVKIQGYKSLADVEVQLQPLTVLFGPNASGKSNFLDALQLLANIATSDNLKQAFDHPYRGKLIESFTFGPEGIPSIRTKERVQFSFDVDVILSQDTIDKVNSDTQVLDVDETDHPKGLSPLETYLRYHIEIEMLPQSAILRIADEYLIPLDSTGLPKTDTSVLDRKLARRELEPTRSMFASNSIFSFFHLPAYQYWAAMRRELAGWAFFYLEPRERMRIPSPAGEVRHIGLMGEELATFLNTLHALDEPQFKAVEKALHVIIPSVTGIEVSINDAGDVDLQLIKDKTPISARLLSEGTLRILGLLALGGVKEPVTLLGFEEPENGIHPDRLDLVASILTNLANENSQVIITTHSPTLLDLLPEKSLHIFRLQNGNTTIESFSSWKVKQRKLRLSEDATASEHLLRGNLYA